MTRRQLFVAACGAPLSGRGFVTRYLRYDDVADAVKGLPKAPTRHQWNGWVTKQDSEIRARVRRGIEDSVSNLLLFGTCFTNLPRGEAREARLQALAAALGGSTFGLTSNERLVIARGELGLAGKSTSGIETILRANLERMEKDQSNPEADLHRGISSDTSLLPNYGVEETLKALAEKGNAPSTIRRIAVIGPGLDFSDKRDGLDYYPLQTLQPFAILETAMRLKLASSDVNVTAFDLNRVVLSHLASKRGKPYGIQLPRDPKAAWVPGAVAYWKQFGSLLGSAATPLPLPRTATGIETRAATIRAEYSAQIHGLDLNIVTQTRDNDNFDLVVATNILEYYERLQQVVSLANVAHMLAPGGLFLCDTPLPPNKPDSLTFLGRRNVSYTPPGPNATTDDFVIYRKGK